MKTAVVTGASYGIGAAIAAILLQNEWKVYGISRSKPKFTNTNFTWLECDLSKTSQIASILSDVREPAIDALVSNAGVAETEQATDASQSSYERTFSVNVLAPMLVVNALRDKITSATIISMSSVSDRIPEADFALYCSSKAANTIYFDSLAEELKSAKVCCLLPDYVDTPMQHRSNDDNKEFDWSACIDPRAIAVLAYDLLSGKSDIESGANIIVVNDKLEDDLRSVEKLYGYNTDTDELFKL